MSEYTVGIDLGTTNSCVAIFKDDQVDIIENEQGQRVTPSWVTFKEDVVLTGLESVDEFHRYTNTTVFEAKRLIGQKFSNPKVQEDIKRFPYTVFNDLGTPKIKICLENNPPKEYYPEEISAYILSALKRNAEERLNQLISRAVITVPAYFSDVQRQATKDAAVIAGFKIINVINEPTAAALAFDHQNKKPYKRNIVVYDFGGGTFDVSIVTIGRNKCEVKATSGDTHLGGTDIDMRLVNFIREDFKKKFGTEIPGDDDYASRRLKNACEKAKKTLSGTQYSTIIELDYVVPGIEYSVTVSRARLEQLNDDIFKTTMRIVDTCMQDSGFKQENIDEVVLVGGSSKIPKIQKLLEEYFGKNKLNKGVNPDEAVAHGAAIYSYQLAADKSEVSDITSLSLGTNTQDDTMSVIIPRNTPIPTKCKKRYQTIIDNQVSMDFPIYQGESETASNNFELGSFEMTGLTLAPANQVLVEACFEMDVDGLLRVSATEINANNTKAITIDMKKKGLTDAQINLRIEEAEKNRAKEAEKKQINREKHALEELLYRVKDFADTYTGSDKDAFLDEYDKIYKWLEKGKIESIDEILEKKKILEGILKTDGN